MAPHPKGVVVSGPYRATKLWNEVVHLFEVGMPTKKHRQLLKVHQDCFTAANAIEWLHALLKENPNFGPHVTRKQTIQLLNKFLKNHVIEDIQGHYGEETLSDNGQLFRFPSKPLSGASVRQPFSTISTNVIMARHDGRTKSLKPVQTTLPKCNPISKSVSPKGVNIRDTTLHSLVQNSKVTSTTKVSLSNPALVWESFFLSSLKRVLHLRDIDDITEKFKLNSDWLIHNMTKVSSSGVVSSPSNEELPCWVISAMKCLSSWPDSMDSGLPTYEGFEKDVFKAIVEYFKALPEPLIPADLYELFTTVLVRCEVLDEMCGSHRHSVAIEDGEANKRTNHDEANTAADRIYKQLIQARMRHENIALRRQRSGRYKKQLFKDDVPRPLPNTDKKKEYMRSHPPSGRIKRNPWSASAQTLDAVAENPPYDRFPDGFSNVARSIVKSVCRKLDQFVDARIDKPITLPDSCRREGDIPFHVGSRLSVNVGSLPELRACEDGAFSGEDEGDFRSRKKAFRSEMDLSCATTLENNQLNRYPLEENVFSSVEDLLLNMSISIRYDPETATENCEEGEENMKELNTCCRIRPTLTPQPRVLCIENQVMKSSHPQLKYNQNDMYYWKTPVDPSSAPSHGWVHQRRSTDDSILKNPANFTKQVTECGDQKMVGGYNSAFNVYHKMVGSGVDQQLQDRDDFKRKPLEGVVRRNRPEDNPYKATYRSSWSGNDVTRSKSDIIARREVPPSFAPRKAESANHIRDRIVKLPYVSSSTANPLQRKKCEGGPQGNHFKRLSKSYSSLHQNFESLPRHLPLHHHKSVRLLQEKSDVGNDFFPSEAPQSPLSAALDQARKNLRRIASIQDKPAHLNESFQLCLLLLSPANRRKLHLLLRMMTKMLSNPHLLNFDESLSLKALLVKKFTDCVVRPRDYSSDVDGKLSERVFCALLDNASVVMKPHEGLKLSVEKHQKATRMKGKLCLVAVGGSVTVICRWINLRSSFHSKPTVAPSVNEASLGGGKLKRQYTFCRQVTKAEYESDNGAHLRNALADLLHATIKDENLSLKEKKKKLKQFQKSHPDVYEAEFPFGEQPMLLSANQKKPKFGSAFRKLRNLR